jgi:hypothetical protein
MGQQQLLLLIMAAIIVGIAIVVGIAQHLENSKAAHQDFVRDALMTVAARAQGWYRRPAMLGGGARSFSAIGWDKINFTPDSTLGTFSLSNLSANSFEVTGISRDDTSWSMTVRVFPDSIALAP